jgi:hypothetical protein
MIDQLLHKLLPTGKYEILLQEYLKILHIFNQKQEYVSTWKTQ